MTYLLGLPVLVLAAVVQSTVLAHVRLAGGGLDLVLLITISWVLAGDWQGGLGWAFLGGLLLDWLSGAPLGLTSIGLVLTAYGASLTEGRFWRSHILLPLAVVIVGTLSFHLITLTLLNLAQHTVPLGPALWQVVLPTLLINTVCMLPLYRMLRAVHGMLYPASVAF